MTWVDYGIIAITVISLIIGLFRGFVREIVSLVVWVAGIVVTLHYLPQIEGYLSHAIGSIYARYAVIIVAVLIVVLLLSWIIGKILQKLISLVGLRFVDRFFGLIFGFIRGVVIVSFLVILLPATEVHDSPGFNDSVILPTVQPLADWFASMIPETFTQKLTSDIKEKLKQEGM